MPRISCGLIGISLLFSTPFVHTQKLNTYLSDMSDSLRPFGNMTGDSCHNLVIELNGPWANYALPASVDKNTGEIKWLILQADIFRLFLNLSQLDEDKLSSQTVFSLSSISKDQNRRPNAPDTPVVLISTKGLNDKMIVHSVDLDKIKQLHGRLGTLKEMGVSMDERKTAILVFEDQAHAATFQKALRSAVIICKALD